MESRSTRAVQSLLFQGADPNLQDSELKTPLHLAGEVGNRRVVEALLAAGAAQDLLDEVSVWLWDDASYRCLEENTGSGGSWLVRA